jgi:hypothetical protein
VIHLIIAFVSLSDLSHLLTEETYAKMNIPARGPNPGRGANGYAKMNIPVCILEIYISCYVFFSTTKKVTFDFPFICTFFHQSFRDMGTIFSILAHMPRWWGPETGFREERSGGRLYVYHL